MPQEYENQKLLRDIRILMLYISLNPCVACIYVAYKKRERGNKTSKEKRHNLKMVLGDCAVLLFYKHGDDSPLPFLYLLE